MHPLAQRFRNILQEKAREHPEFSNGPIRVVVNRRPSIGFSYSRNDDGLAVQISDILVENSPDEVLEAVAHLIMLGACKGAYSSHKRLLFEKHKRTLESDDKIIRELLHRDGRIRFGARGSHFDLKERFDAVNSEYFNGVVPELNLAWTSKAEKTRWGYTYRERKLIVVNRQLDGPRVPTFVVDYILYHEMLHIVHKGLLSRFGREDHYVDFYRDEKRFRRYEEAEEWLKRNS